jgi:hypothetical protein
MPDMAIQKAVVLASNPTGIDHSTPLQLALVNPDGSQAGTVKKAAAQADSTASTVAALVTDFNALLAKLRSAGVIS